MVVAGIVNTLSVYKLLIGEVLSPWIDWKGSEFRAENNVIFFGKVL